EPGAVRRERLERHRPAEAGAQHHVFVAGIGADVLHELERLAAATERERVDDAAEEAVAVGVAGPDDVHVEDGRRVLFPEIVALEERPEPAGGVRQLDRELVPAHRAGWYVNWPPN